MDIKELDKRQLILLTLLITFVVSIATGIVTVSLMNQMPKTVPQTINNVIQRTIERVTTVETPTKTDNSTTITKDTDLVQGDGEAIVSIYRKGSVTTSPENNTSTNEANGDVSTDNSSTLPDETDKLGDGVIISDLGLVLVDSSILNGEGEYKVILSGIDFKADILKKFNNGFTILKISENKSNSTKTSGTSSSDQIKEN